jgi:hypothetical protein
MRKGSLAISVLLAAAVCWIAAPALAGDAMPPAGAGSTQPDPLAGLAPMLGDWQGSGTTSAMGPYYVRWRAWREGQLAVMVNDIYDHQGGKYLEGVTQVFAGAPDGGIVCYMFDSSGESEMHGTADASGGKLHWQDGDAHRDMTWIVQPDGSLKAHLDSHLPEAPAPYTDMTIDETDQRLGDAGSVALPAHGGLDLPADQPDPLAALAPLLGEWKGSGTATPGPFNCRSWARRVGMWIVAYAHITTPDGQPVANNVQVYGADAQGNLVGYTFDESGAAIFKGSATKDGGHFRWEQGADFRDFSYTVAGDGTVASEFKMHTPEAPDPF